MITSHLFLERHAALMGDPDAALVCCYESPKGAFCDAQATHGLIRHTRTAGRYEVVPRDQLPLQRDDYDTVGRPPRGRHHPEFCQAHAEAVCALRQDRKGTL